MTKHFVKLVVIEGHYGKTNMYANMTAISEAVQSNFMDRIFRSEQFQNPNVQIFGHPEYGLDISYIYLQGKSSQEVPGLRHISVY